MSLAILFHFLCAQHVSDINISIIRGLRLFCWITTLVVLFLVRCVLAFRCGWVGLVSVLQAEASDINLVFYSSTITMMHCPVNIRYKSTYLTSCFWCLRVAAEVTELAPTLPLFVINLKFSIPKCYTVQISTIRQSVTQHLFYIQWYICQVYCGRN